MIRGFPERYFLTDYSRLLENHFYYLNVPDYCFTPSLSRMLYPKHFLLVNTFLMLFYTFVPFFFKQ